MGGPRSRAAVGVAEAVRQWPDSKQKAGPLVFHQKARQLFIFLFQGERLKALRGFFRLRLFGGAPVARPHHAVAHPARVALPDEAAQRRELFFR